MADGLRLLAPLLLAAYLGVTFVWRSYRVWRRTGVNPYVLSREDDLEGVIARFFRLSVLLLVAVVGVYAASERAYELTAPLAWLERPCWQGVGAALLAASLVWTAAAQAQMGASWRIGLGRAAATELVAHGLFARSVRPVTQPHLPGDARESARFLLLAAERRNAADAGSRGGAGPASGSARGGVPDAHAGRRLPRVLPPRPPLAVDT